MPKELLAPTRDEECANVHTPLLGDFPRQDQDFRSNPPKRPRYLVLGLIMSIIFLTELAGSISKAPLVRIFESIICEAHFIHDNPTAIGRPDVGEKDCKVGSVQKELALLRGWRDFFNYVPGLFLAIPIGMLADRYGRKWLAVLNVASMSLCAVWICFICAFSQTLSIRLIWLESAFGVLGGGSIVASTLFMVIMTDVTPESQRANVFFYTHATICATEFFGPPLGSVLMERNPWLALGVSSILLLLAVPLALILPETLEMSNHSLDREKTSSHQHQSSFSRSMPWRTTITDVMPSLGFLLADRRILIILFTSVSFVFGQASTNLIIQYTSQRYDWSLSKAAYLSSARAVIMVIALLGLLPLASNYLVKKKLFAPLSKDTLLLRISFVFVTIGLLVEGLAPNIPIFIMGCCVATVGMGASALIRSLLSTLVKQNEVARLFSIMSLIWTAAMLVASPVLAGLFAKGIKSGGILSGCPFLFSALLFAAATAVLGLTSLAGPTMREREELEEELEGEKDALLGQAP